MKATLVFGNFEVIEDGNNEGCGEGIVWYCSIRKNMHH